MSYKNKEDENRNKREYYSKNKDLISAKKKEKWDKLPDEEKTLLLLKMRDRSAARHQALISARTDIKKNGCAICGYNKNAAALDFHHLDPNEKELKIGNPHAVERLLKEIEKCIVLCANCHREIHHPGGALC